MSTKTVTGWSTSMWETVGTRACSAGRRGSLPALAKKTGPGLLPKGTAGAEAVAIHLKEGMFRVGIRT